MSRKKIAVAAGAVLIVVVLAVIVGIIAFPRGNEERNSAPNETVTTVNLDGTWLVYHNGEGAVDDEFIVFDGGTATDYRGGESEPYMTSSYTYGDDGMLSLPDVSKSFTVRVTSDDHISLVESENSEWKMIRVAAAGQEIQAVTATGLVGDYDVLSHAGQSKAGETMTFTETSLADYQDGAEYMSCDYQMTDEHTLYVPDLDTEFKVYDNGSRLMLIEGTDQYIWELARK